MKRTTYIYGIIIMGSIASLIVVLLVAVAPSLRQRIYGNSPIVFYGQVTDANGNGVEGIKITFDILYSTSVSLPIPFSGDEKHREASVASDENGYFVLDNIYGYGVHAKAFTWNGRQIELQAAKLKAQDDPMYGVTTNTTSWSKLPDIPQKRIVYKVVEVK